MTYAKEAREKQFMKSQNFRDCGEPWGVRYLGFFTNNLRLVNSIPNKFQYFFDSYSGAKIRAGYQTMSAKNWVMSDQSCFTTGTIVRREDKKKFISYQGLRTNKHSVSIGLFCSGFSFYEHFNRKFAYAVFFILKTIRLVWVKRFYTNTLLLFCSA